MLRNPPKPGVSVSFTSRGMRYSLLSGANINSECPYDIKILSYNIFMRPPFVRSNEDDFKNERLAEFLKSHIEKFDILCLQEVRH